MDYGNKSHVDLDLLMEIPGQLLELPFQVGRLHAMGWERGGSLFCDTSQMGRLLFPKNISL